LVDRAGQSQADADDLRSFDLRLGENLVDQPRGDFDVLTACSGSLWHQRSRSRLRSGFVLAALCVAAGVPAGLLGAAAPARADASCPWMNTQMSPDQRAQ
jgi:hypothetical protein